MPQQRRFPKVKPSPEGGSETPSTPGHKGTEPLGKLLLEAGAITKAQLEAALTAQRKSFAPLGRILRDEHGLSEDALSAALRKQTHCPRIYLRFFPIDEKTLNSLDRQFCVEHQAIPIEKLGNLLCVALHEPKERDVLKQLQADTNLEVKAFTAPWEDIKKKLKIVE